jgi:hypothetical protein
VTRDTYDAGIVLAFVTAHVDETGLYLNCVRLDSNQRQKLARWAGYETIPMHRVDSFLMRHGLMLFELEMWALDNPDYATDGFNSENLLPYY